MEGRGYDRRMSGESEPTKVRWTGPSRPMPANLAGWIEEWCSRPGMYLIDDDLKLSVRVLDAYVSGFQVAKMKVGRTDEERPFSDWLAARLPDRGRQPLGSYFLERTGSAGEALKAILNLVREFQAQP